MTLDPKELAQQQAAQNRRNSERKRIDRLLEQDTAELPTFWQGFDPESGRHIVQRLGADPVTIANSISSGGYQQGQAIDAAFGQGYTAINTRPYIKRELVTPIPPTVAEIHAAIVISVSTTVSDPDTGTTTLPLRGFVKISDKPLFQLPFGFPVTSTSTNTVAVPIAKNDWVFQFGINATRWKNGTFTTITGTLDGGVYTFPANSFSNYLLNSQGFDAIDSVIYQQTAVATGFEVRTTDTLTVPWDKKWSKIATNSDLNPVRWYSVLLGIDVYAKPDTYRGASGTESNSKSTTKKRFKLGEQDIINLGFTLDTPIASTGGTPFGTFGSPTETGSLAIQVTETSGDIVTRTTLGIARQRAILINV